MQKIISLFIIALLGANMGWAQNYGENLEPNDDDALLKCVVINENKEPRKNEIVKFESLKTGKIYKGITGADGKFNILIPKGEKYKIKYLVINKWNENNEMEIPTFDGLFTQNLTIQIYNYKVREYYDLKVFYETGKADLKAESFPELDQMAEVLNARTKLKIAIEGHTDNVGADADNLTLSQKRAESVRAYLAKKGVQIDRLEAKGFGETKPIESNDTDTGRANNRRTEVRIIGGYFD